MDLQDVASMPKYLEDQTVTLEQRRSLIAALPCFSELTLEEKNILAGMFHEVSYDADEAIVVEDDLIDTVYIIVSGRAEVTHKKSSKFDILKTNLPIGELYPGEAIGLNRTGFFSTTGKRTASVTALTPMQLLALDIKKLQQFLHQYRHVLVEMSLVAEKMLRMRLIKQSLPFSKLSHERLEWLANQVESISVPAGTVLFKQGEMGHCCYLIRSGQVEIVSKENGELRQLAILKSPILFGEATLIARSPRNATARALENCELLVLQHQHLTELIETEKNIADMLMILMIDRSRPIQNQNITVHPRITADGQEVVVLKNANNGTYFKLSTEGWFIWQQLNGKNTLQEITMALTDKFGMFAPHVVAGLISKLSRENFISNVATHIEKSSRKQSFFSKWTDYIANALTIRISIGNADKWLTVFYKKGVHWLFSRNSFLLLYVWAVAGLCAFSFSTYHIIYLFRTIHDSWVLFILLIPFTVLTVVIHELAHAFAVKFFGHEVRYIGVGWDWIKPIAFVDTTDMWLSTRWPRIIVNLAGPFSDVIVAGMMALLIFMVSNPYLQCFLWLFALYTYINAFGNLSPLQDRDGYFILMDLFDYPDLRYFSVKWLLRDYSETLGHPRVLKKFRAEIYFWLACIVYLILVSLVTLYVQSVFFKMLGLHFNVALNLILPFVAVIISSVEMYINIRRERD
jgi:CRP-like cAMP-binding protein